MCLNVNRNVVNSKGTTLFRNQDPQIATSDIPVYKVLGLKSDISGYGFPYAPNSHYTKKDISANKLIQERGIAAIGNTVIKLIDEGFHVLPLNKQDVLNFTGFDTTDPRITFQRVIRMTIPKGSKYFIGGHNNLSDAGCVGYCSEELVTTTLDHDYAGLGDTLPVPVVNNVPNVLAQPISVSPPPVVGKYTMNRLTPRGLATLSNKAKAQQRGPGGRFV